MAKQLNMNAGYYLDYKNMFFDLMMQLGGEKYRKDNYNVFATIASEIENDNQIIIDGSYYPMTNSIEFIIVNHTLSKRYSIYYDGEEKLFTQETIYDAYGNILKDLELR